MTKKTYKIQGMHCTSCALVIESELEDAGVKARCDYARETLEVEFDETKTVTQTIKDIISAVGYQIVDN